MKVSISVHDTSPAFIREIEFIHKELSGIEKSWFITPLWHGKNSITKEFAGVLNGEDLALHGLTHLSVKSDFNGKFLLCSKTSAKELYGLNQTETIEKIKTAKSLFEDALNQTPVSFIPPMWYHNQHSLCALKSLEFKFTETEKHLVDLRNNHRIFSIPVCLDFGNNKFLNHTTRLGWKYIFKYIEQPVLRISIHPADVKNGFWKDLLNLIQWLKEKNALFIRHTQIHSS